MDVRRDPLGFYAALGVGADAEAEEIRAAWRARAKESHPDHNRSAGAAEEFQRYQQAYEVVGDPAKRAAYDRFAARQRMSGSDAAITDQELHLIEPLFCESCGKVTAQPRFVIFLRTISFLFVTVRKPIGGVLCRACADKKMLSATLVTWLLAWWGVPWGPIYGVQSLVVNLRGGRKPGDINASLLGRQALAFLGRGQRELAANLIRQAYDYAESANLKSKLAELARELGEPRQRLSDAWSSWRVTQYIAAAPVLPILAILVIATEQYHVSKREPPSATVPANSARAWPNDPQTASATGLSADPFADLIPSPASVSSDGTTARRVVEVVGDRVNVRAAPNVNSAIIGRLSRGNRAIASELTSDGWMTVSLRRQELGFVRQDFVRAIEADPSQFNAHCAQDRARPENGTVVIPSNGKHKIIVRNGTSEDGVVKLRGRDDNDVAGLYVWARSSAQLSTVPDGNYSIVFSHGEAWSSVCLQFVRPSGAQIFEQVETFRVKVTEDGMYTQILELTLHEVPHGNAATEPFPPDAF